MRRLAGTYKKALPFGLDGKLIVRDGTLISLDAHTVPISIGLDRKPLPMDAEGTPVPPAGHFMSPNGKLLPISIDGDGNQLPMGSNRRQNYRHPVCPGWTQMDVKLCPVDMNLHQMECRDCVES